jgi:hypothetical protein
MRALVGCARVRILIFAAVYIAVGGHGFACVYAHHDLGSVEGAGVHALALVIYPTVPRCLRFRGFAHSSRREVCAGHRRRRVCVEERMMFRHDVCRNAVEILRQDGFGARGSQPCSLGGLGGRELVIGAFGVRAGSTARSHRVRTRVHQTG